MTDIAESVNRFFGEELKDMSPLWREAKCEINIWKHFINDFDGLEAKQETCETYSTKHSQP